MAKAVLTTKVDSTYDDLPEERYHFPSTYLRTMEQAKGDWIIYYEPRRTSGVLSSRGGRQAYFATARVTQIDRDPLRDGHFYAFVSDYLEFDHPVPFKEGRSYFESILQRSDGNTNKGAFGRAVRSIPDHEYSRIVQEGFAKSLETMHYEAQTLTDVEYSSAEKEIAPYIRPVVEQVVARPFRDAAFSTAVKDAYDNTCAMTGLKIINGGGRAEVQAAHIQPVAHNGPDSIRNALALSATVHWMFDRGLISVDDDFSILVACERLPDMAQRLLNDNHRLILPRRPDMYPHHQFLFYHREHIFKG